MKKIVKSVALLLCLVLSLSMTVLAANTSNDLGIISAENGAVVEFISSSADEDEIRVTYSNAAVVSGNYYTVFVLANDGSENIVPTTSNIIYMTQVEGGSGSVTFTIYASKNEGAVDDCIVVIGGVGSGVVRVATIESAISVGDVNGDDKINSADLIRLAKYIANKTTPISSEKAADANGDGKVNSADLIRLAKYIANKNSVTLG